MSNDEWIRHSEYVLKKLENLDKKADLFFEKLISCEKKISELKVQAGIWGVLGGAAVIVVTLSIQTFK